MTTAVSNEERIKSEKLVGVGLTSEVFSWGEGRVLKLFFDWVPSGAAQREFTATQAVHAAGVPAPAAFEIVKVSGRDGVVFERIEGISMLRRVELKPWVFTSGPRQLAELHAQLHSHTAPPGLPLQREQLDRWIDEAEGFLEGKKEMARELAATLPPGNTLCHGDFHPANILLAARGPVIIDWSGATRGHALADVARTSVLFESASLPEGSPFHTRLIMKVARQWMHASYLKHYLKLRPGTLEEIEKWRVPQRMAWGAVMRARRSAAKKFETNAIA